jgi:hypothetical protein
MHQFTKNHACAERERERERELSASEIPHQNPVLVWEERA